MHIHDPDHKGPYCRMCCKPIKEGEGIPPKREGDPWFCSNECILAKYIG